MQAHRESGWGTSTSDQGQGHTSSGWGGQHTSTSYPYPYPHYPPLPPLPFFPPFPFRSPRPATEEAGKKAIEELTVKVEKNTKHLKEVIGKLKDADAKSERLESHIESLLVDKRRKNCKLSGIEEYQYETKTELIRKIVDIFGSQYRGWELNETDIETAYRVGKRGRQPRPVIVVFLRQSDAERVLGDFEGKGGVKARFGVRVGPDLTAKQRQEMNELWERGMMGTLKGGKVVPVERGYRDRNQRGDRGYGRYEYGGRSRYEDSGRQGFGRYGFGRHGMSDEARERQRPTHNPRNLVPVREQRGGDRRVDTRGSHGRHGGLSDCDDYEIDFDPTPTTAIREDHPCDPCGDWVPFEGQGNSPYVLAGGEGERRDDGRSRSSDGGEGRGTVLSVDTRAAVKPQTGATSPPSSAPRDGTEALPTSNGEGSQYIFAAETDEDEAGENHASHEEDTGDATEEKAEESEQEQGQGTSGNESENVNNNKDKDDSERAGKKVESVENKEGEKVDNHEMGRKEKETKEKNNGNSKDKHYEKDKGKNQQSQQSRKDPMITRSSSVSSQKGQSSLESWRVGNRRDSINDRRMSNGERRSSDGPKRGGVKERACTQRK